MNHASEGGRALRRIVVTGSECTGKTTLAGALAVHFGVPCAGEFSRAYAERLAPRELTAADVEPIARGQIAFEDAACEQARARGASLVVLDTDLSSTVVYAQHYYGSCPAWIEDAARARRAELYLLCLPDLPWIADGVRDRPRVREAIHALFAEWLAALGARVTTVGGAGDARLAAALAAVEASEAV